MFNSFISLGISVTNVSVLIIMEITAQSPSSSSRGSIIILSLFKKDKMLDGFLSENFILYNKRKRLFNLDSLLKEMFFEKFLILERLNPVNDAR